MGQQSPGVGSDSLGAPVGIGHRSLDQHPPFPYPLALVFSSFSFVFFRVCVREVVLGRSLGALTLGVGESSSLLTCLKIV